MKYRRLILPDGTSWPCPGVDAKHFPEFVSAYSQLVTHPWGGAVSQQKIRWLRKAYRQAMEEETK